MRQGQHSKETARKAGQGTQAKDLVTGCNKARNAYRQWMLAREDRQGSAGAWTTQTGMVARRALYHQLKDSADQVDRRKRGMLTRQDAQGSM